MRKNKSKDGVFYSKRAQDINVARIHHLESLELDISNKTIIEFGAGPAGDFTSFFEKNGCSVLVTDGRKKNIIEHSKRSPYRKTALLNFDKICDKGVFDISFAYGSLYHSEHPNIALRNFRNHCREMLLLETRVSYIDNDNFVFRKEKKRKNQGLNFIGCLPSRDWIFNNLNLLFPFVYLTKTQPLHDEFPIKWPVKNRKSCRAVFVASMFTIENDNLSPNLLNIQRRIG